MAWQERLKEAAYTSPDGTRTVFQYENVGKSVTKKTTGFEFPDADGTYVQDLGHSGRRYPLRMFFWGPDYDLQADAFEESLIERGVGKLEHPLYGTVDVVPFGAITRRDDLKTAANQAVIQVTFWETIGLIYPSSQQDPASSVLNAVGGYNELSAEELEGSLGLGTAIERVSFRDKYQALLDRARSTLQPIADAQDNVRQQFDAIGDSINEGIDVLISDPLTLAFQTVLFIQSPARVLQNITARLEAYGALATSLITGDSAVSQPGNDSRNSNEFHVTDLYASTYVTGSIVSVVNNQFVTKTEALQAAEIVLQQFEGVAAWRDDNFQSLAEVDTGAAYQKLQEAVALTAGFLVEISFTLKQERSVVLDRPRTAIDVAAELYGTVDVDLDFLINSNNLSGSEILELPEGREIVFYV